MLKSCLTCTLVALFLAGCSSTQPELNIENGEVVFPPLPLASNNVYVWDDSKSEALNVAHMALPAGVGNGLRDMDNGEDATTGKISGGSRLFDSALGLAGSGLFGVLQSESLTGGVNRALDWKPSIVEIVEYTDGTVDYISVRDTIISKVKSALSREFVDIEFGDALFNKGNLDRPTVSLQVYSEHICKEVRPFSSIFDEVEPFLRHNLTEFYYDGENKVDEYCELGMKLTPTFITSDNDVVVVAEITSGLYFAPYLAKSYEGYVIYPDLYSINSVKNVVLKYPFVADNGKELLFQKP